MFNDWLLEQLRERHWIPADLARESGLTGAAISRYLNGRTPDIDSIKKIAKALKLPIENVLRAAGDLEPAKDIADEMIAEIKHLMADLPMEEQKAIVEYTKMRHRIVEEREKLDASKRNRTRPAPSTHS